MLSSQTAAHLLKETETSTLISGNHVQTVMEAVGQGFGLPMEVIMKKISSANIFQESEIIDQAIELYKRWLLNKPKRPPPIEADEKTFFLVFFCNFFTKSKFFVISRCYSNLEARPAILLLKLN